MKKKYVKALAIAAVAASMATGFDPSFTYFLDDLGRWTLIMGGEPVSANTNHPAAEIRLQEYMEDEANLYRRPNDSNRATVLLEVGYIDDIYDEFTYVDCGLKSPKGGFREHVTSMVKGTIGRISVVPSQSISEYGYAVAEDGDNIYEMWVGAGK